MERIVCIAASAGGFQAILRIVAALPRSSTASFFIVLHIGSRPSRLPNVLQLVGSRLPASHPENGDLIEPGHIYVAPPDQHMRVADGRIRLRRDPKVNFTRPAADPLFTSAAKAFGSQVIGVVLSGGGKDGAEGLRAIKEGGGITVVEDPNGAPYPNMPLAAVAADSPKRLTAAMIAEFLIASVKLV
jgi:two-component system chemotaxis response regulator CheB